ncbi:transporter [Lithospermum erythrorhizon]|uniref:Protein DETOXIFICATION n=1 Tax=Lithospermum erythrorhizon TaxID=34254 RepID=A0AAV3QHY3_LITER
MNDQIDSSVPLLKHYEDVGQRSRRVQTMLKVMEEVKQLLAIALPMILTGLMVYGKSMISTMFMGRLGRDALAGGSLSIAVANITGYSVIYGLATGMEAISSQAYGANQLPIIGQTLRRTILILLITAIPISVFWLHVKPVLILCGQEPRVADFAAIHLRACIPTLLLKCFIHPLRIYSRTQHRTLPLMLSAAVALLIHTPINCILQFKLKLGITGIALAVGITDFNLVIVLVLAIRYSGAHRDSWGGWSLQCFKQWGPILKLAVPSCVWVCLEWWWYELMIILAGLFPYRATEAVGTMGVLVQATSLMYIFPSSLSMAVSTRVGNELGANQPCKAKFSSLVALTCSVFTGIGAMIFMMTLRDVWGRAFTSDHTVVALTALALPVVGLCELGNCPQTIACGVLKGSARPKLGAHINLGSFYGVGLPVVGMLCFVMKVGFVGFWYGLLAAQIVCAILMIVTLVNTNWEAEGERARELLGVEEYNQVPHQTWEVVVQP